MGRREGKSRLMEEEAGNDVHVQASAAFGRACLHSVTIYMPLCSPARLL